jgi:3-hydroxyisobutyrate dehydrogenase-like beta-hydroxyacid dehydrogenase
MPSFETVALLHPGNMGVTIGACAATGGAQVLWASAERSPATRKRALAAGLQEVRSLGDAVAQSELILSVCPPHAAVNVAERVAALNFSGVYVDANAVSRETAEHIGRIVTGGGASFVDGGIIGSPVKRPGTTRLYLSGDRAQDVADLFSKSMLEAKAIGAVPGAASALKVAYAAWTKGTDALLLAIRAYASREGVDDALLQEWRISQPALEKRCEQAAAVAAPKAWRYVGEMREIAAAFAKDGLPAGFHNAAAEVCERLDAFKDRSDPAPKLANVIEALLPGELRLGPDAAQKAEPTSAK